LKVPDSIRYSETLEASPAELIDTVREQGFEGIVAKRRGSLYEPGKRSGAYFSGNAAVSKDGAQQMLALMPYDVRLSDMSNVLFIKDVRTAMESSRALYKLLVTDTCHGTVGFTEEHFISPQSTLLEAPIGPVFQFLAGTKDDEYGSESSSIGGGVFTHALVKVLLTRNPQAPLAMSEILQRVSMEMSTEARTFALGHSQQPQLVTLGQGNIFWPPQSTISASP
jgi:Caspase domain